MNCKNCNKNKNISKFRKNRKTCIKCEYQTRKDYLKKYRNDNREKLNQYNNIYLKSKNWYYVPVSQRLTEPNSQGYYKPRPRKPKIIIDKNNVRTLSEKDIDLNIELELIL